MSEVLYCLSLEGYKTTMSPANIYILLPFEMGFPGGSDSKLPAVQESQVQSLGWKDLLEKGIPTPVSLHGEFHGQRSLVGYSSWDFKGLDTTERLTLSLMGFPGSAGGKEPAS